MPITKSGRGQMPSWCELSYFEVLTLATDENRELLRRARREKLIVGAGQCRIQSGGQVVTGEYGTNIDLVDEDDHFALSAIGGPTTLVWLCGDWAAETSSGIFTVAKSDGREDKGDVVDYLKETSFDAHYHDCDEYWILFEGCGVAVSEGHSYEVGPGDCVATGMGFHHDFPMVSEPVKSVYFETGLEGQKRRGHLWNHTHGEAVPQEERR